MNKNVGYWPYAGIGSRETPANVLEIMTRIGAYFGTLGWTLRSGGADGADHAFEIGSDQSPSSKKEIYLPWLKFKSSKSLLALLRAYPQNITKGDLEELIPEDLLDVCKKYHPAYDRLHGASLALMCRNGWQVLGADLKTPAKFVVCYTKDGKASGGTGQALRIASDYGIPIYNLHDSNARLKLLEYVRQWESEHLGR